MKFCSNCGKEIANEDAVICVNCGTALKNDKVTGDDASSTGMAVLGFFIPVLGLIMYFMYKDKQPLKAKSACKGAIIGFIVSIIVGIIWGVVYGVLMSSYLW